MAKCKKCGHVNKAGAVICSKCGAPLKLKKRRQAGTIMGMAPVMKTSESSDVDMALLTGDTVEEPVPVLPPSPPVPSIPGPPGPPPPPPLPPLPVAAPSAPPPPDLPLALDDVTDPEPPKLEEPSFTAPDFELNLDKVDAVLADLAAEVLEDAASVDSGGATMGADVSVDIDVPVDLAPDSDLPPEPEPAPEPVLIPSAPAPAPPPEYGMPAELDFTPAWKKHLPKLAVAGGALVLLLIVVFSLGGDDDPKAPGPDAKPVATADTKKADEAKAVDKKAEPKPDATPKPTPAPKNEPKPDGDDDVIDLDKLQAAEAKPEADDKVEPKPEPKAEPKPKPEPKAEPKPEPKAEVKAEPKPEPKAEAKAEPKPEPKAEPKPEPKVEPKPEPKAEPKVEPKPEPKAEPKPEPKPVIASGKAHPRIPVTYEPAAGGAKDGEARELVKGSGLVEQLSAVLGPGFATGRKKRNADRPIPITFKSCTSARAYGGDGTVTFCYKLVTRLNGLFANDYKGKDLVLATQGAVMWLLKHLVGREYNRRLDIVGRMDEADLELYGSWLLAKRAESDPRAKQLAEHVARGAAAIIKASVGKTQKRLMRTPFWKGFYMTTSRLRDVICYSYAVSPKDWMIGRTLLKAKRAKKCEAVLERSTRPIARKMKRYLK